MRAVIFDVDGVIVDVRESYHTAIKETAQLFLRREVPLETIKRIKYSRAINNDWDVTYEVIREFGGSADYEELVRRFTEIYEKHREREKQIISSALFRDLSRRGVPLGIVTGRPREDLDFVLDRFGLREFFSAVVDEDDIVDKSLRKPHPFPLHLCMELLSAEEGIYVGDNTADLEMVLYYRKMYAKPVKFVHFKKVVDLDLPADFSTDSEEELREYLLREACPNPEAERVSLP